MSFEITETKDGFEVLLKFSKSTAELSIIKTDTENVWYLSSDTDGYHWLHFWMAQDPGSLKALELPHQNETEKCRRAMESLGFFYKNEDKETCYLTINNLNKEIVAKLAQFLEPRFALREKFFPDDFK